MANRKKVVFRQLDYAALVRAAAGPEKPDVVYRFRDREFTERPGYNPFAQRGGNGGSN